MDGLDVRSLVLQALTTGAMALIFVWLARSRSPVKHSHGSFELCYPLGVRALGIVGAVLLAGCGIFGLTSGQQWAGVISALLVIPFVFLWVESLTVFVVDAEQITRIARFRQPSVLRWDQVTSIDVGSALDGESHELVLRSKVRGGLHLSGTLSGRVIVARILLERVSKTALADSTRATAYLERVVAVAEAQGGPTP